MTTGDPHGKRRGFTLIEVFTVLMVVSVVVRIGIPSYQEVRTKAMAAQVVADLKAIRVGVVNYNAETHGWPGDAGPGQVPPGLEPFLEGVSFNRGYYQLDWEHWALPSGLPNHPGVGTVLAISLETENRALAAAVKDLLGSSRAHFSVGDSHTFVLDAF